MPWMIQIQFRLEPMDWKLQIKTKRWSFIVYIVWVGTALLNNLAKVWQ